MVMEAATGLYEEHGTQLGYGAYGSVLKVRRIADGHASTFDPLVTNRDLKTSVSCEEDNPLPTLQQL